MDRIGEMRFWATHWNDGIEVGHWIRWNPARDVDSIATFQILSSHVPNGCNSVYKVDLARILVDVHIVGETFTRPQLGHLIRTDDDLHDPRRYGP